MEEEKEKKPWDNIPRYSIEQCRRKAQIFDDTLKYLHKSKRLKKYLEGFNPATIEQQLESYAWRKADWIAKREYDEYWNDWKLIQTKVKAEECLANIQQKKLFDKQVLWRAEQFTHPAIETTYDFMYWERDVLNCPFIDPVTPEDVELYIEYLNEYFGEDLAFLGSWQDYDTYCTNRVTVLGQMHKQEIEDAIKEEKEHEEEDDENTEEEENLGERLMPPWYLFWEEHRGALNYSLYTDKRKDKELVYSRLGHKEYEDKIRAEHALNPPDRRPFLALYDEKVLLSFIKKYENPAERKEIMQGYETNLKIYYNKEQKEAMDEVQEAWYVLEDCYEHFPIEPGITDWKEALIATADRWEHVKLIRMIPVVYDEYLFRLDTGIAQPQNEERSAHYRKFADDYKASILRGRELKGEPRDLNF